MAVDGTGLRPNRESNGFRPLDTHPIDDGLKTQYVVGCEFFGHASGVIDKSYSAERQRK
jgi:hypothetical protein